MTRRRVFILILATLVLYAWPAYRHWSSNREPARFIAGASPASRPPEAPFIQREFITPESTSGIVHVASICHLSQGTLTAAWYGGTREGAGDVAIFISTKGPHDASWSDPKVLVDRASASRELSRYVRKVGNPLLFAGPGDRLRLIYVTIALGGWSGSSLNIKTSGDGGATWSTSQRLTLSPFFNISELVRNRPLPLSHGGFAVPIYHECLGDFPEILWLEPGHGGDIGIRKTRMAGGRSYIQPAIAALDPLGAVACYRSRSMEKAIGRAVTQDAGITWSAPENLPIPNPDAAVDAIALPDQRILLAFNDSPVNRETLSLALSVDRGHHWTRVATIEEAQGKEFSYPYMIRTPDGRIHLVYTWDRKRIRHVVFNEAWIEARLKERLR